MMKSYSDSAGGPRPPDFPRHVTVLQVTKVLLIPAVVGMYFILEYNIVPVEWKLESMIAFLIVAVGVMVAERTFRKRHLKANRARIEESLAFPDREKPTE